MVCNQYHAHRGEMPVRATMQVQQKGWHEMNYALNGRRQQDATDVQQMLLLAASLLLIVA
jgi:hypothetical protein